MADEVSGRVGGKVRASTIAKIQSSWKHTSVKTVVTRKTAANATETCLKREWNTQRVYNHLGLDFIPG